MGIIALEVVSDFRLCEGLRMPAPSRWRRANRASLTRADIMPTRCDHTRVADRRTLTARIGGKAAIAARLAHELVAPGSAIGGRRKFNS